MKKLMTALVLIMILIHPVYAAEFTAPDVPEQAQRYLPESPETFADGLQTLLKNALPLIRPDLKEACRSSLAVMAAGLMISILQSFSGSVKNTAILVGTVSVASVLLLSANSLIQLGSQTVVEMSEYGKLLLPVMTAVMAAQGSVTTSAALYGGTALFSALLGNLMSRVFIPMIYLFLALSVANSALGEEMLKNIRDVVKAFVSWSLKTLLTVFTTYMAITGVISGSTDAAVLKATKVSISTFVPVVGSILSDASEAVLVSAGLAKSAAGLYGILAILALFVEPFVKIGIHYLLLKITASLSQLFSPKSMSDLVGDFSTAMGLLLGMTGSECLLQLISTVCFLKGAT